MDDVGQDRELLSFLYLVRSPIICQLVARLLTGHPLRDPLLATAQRAPVVSRTLQRHGRIGHFLEPFMAHLCQPFLERFRTRRWNRLDETQNARYIPTEQLLDSSRCFERQCKGGDNLSPP